MTIPPKASKSLIPAAAYIRMSSSKQEASPAQQRAEIAKLAAKHGCTIVAEFFDDAISGDDTPRRRGFQNMHQAACNGGDFKVILCWDQDRFGRFDQIEAGYWIWPLRSAGVKLITVAQGIISWDDFQGRLLYMIQQEGKHQFLVDLSRNSLRGHLDGAREGLWQGGPAPYGYKLVKQRLVPDPKTAPIVRRIYKELRDGASTREVADRLNRDGIPSPHGKTWRFSGISRLVKKRVYLGEFRFGDGPDGRYHWATADGMQNGRNARKDRCRKEANPLVIPQTHKALVSVADFDKVQVGVKERTRLKSPYRPKDNPYLLSSLLKCAHCSSSMVGINPTYPGHPDYVCRSYVCAGYQQGGTSVCKRHYVREDAIFDVLIRKLEEDLLNPALLAELSKELRRQLKPAAKVGENPQRLRKQIDTLDKRIDQGAEKLLAAPPILTAILTAKLDEWRHQRDALEASLKALKQPAAVSTADLDKQVEEAFSQLQTLRESLQQADKSLVRDVLREMVSKVELWWKWRPERKRERAVLARGLIHLRPELQAIKLVSTVVALG